jgi:hypothetical protein
MCDVNQCLVFTFPHSELGRTGVLFQYRNAKSVKAAVRAAHEEHLDDDGEVINEHDTEVHNAYLINSISIAYAKSYTISYIIANEIAISYTI